MKTQNANMNFNDEVKSHMFSMEHLDRIGNHDADFNLLMLKKFSASVQENIEGLKVGYLSNDWNAIRKVVHKSIPSYHMMGLEKLVGYMQSIQAKIDRNEHINSDGKLAIEKDIDLLQQENTNLLTEINDYISQLEGSK